MRGDNFRDIVAFLAVARERSFTRAAAQLGVSQSALSHTIRSLKARLGLRLLTRTTRSVAPTEAGERLIRAVAPRFDVISEELAAFHEQRDKPMGAVRITTSDAANTVLWPKLSELQPRYPDIKIELTVDAGLTDIVEERYDAGVRFGDQIAKNMAAVPISPDIRMSIVGAPSYLSKHSPLKLPADLSEHSCINTRFSSRAGVYLGTQQRQAQCAGPGGRPLDVQFHFSRARRGTERCWTGLRAGTTRASSSGERPSAVRFEGLVPHLSRAIFTMQIVRCRPPFP